MKNKTLLLTLFIIVSIFYVLGILLDNLTLKFIFKPLIIVVLTIFYIASVNKKNKLFLSALFFSFFGDTMLLFETETSFLIGLVSFLMAHVLFIILVIRFLNQSNLKHKIAALIPFAILYAGLLFVLKDNLADMLIPVVVYGLVISIFGSVSLLNYLTSRSKEGMYLLTGAILFVISDSVLAINKFNQAEAYYPILIITTYILAQYFICKYMIVKSKEL